MDAGFFLPKSADFAKKRALRRCVFAHDLL